MDNNLGKIISDLRNKKGVTQKELADAIHVSDKAISRWETGASLPTLETIHALSKFFHVSFKDLLSARVSTEGSDELANDIIKEFDEDCKKKTKIIRMILFASFVAILLLTSINIFTRSYNKFKVYKIMTVSDDFYEINGMYVETRIKDSLFLNDIRLKHYEVKSSDIVTVNIYYVKNNKKYILDSFPRLRNIQLVNYNSDIENLSDIFENLYINVNIIDNNLKEYNYDTRLKFIIDFSNNKLYEESNDYNAPIVNYSSEEIIEILIKNGFNMNNPEHLEKSIDKYLFSYHPVTNKVNINFENNSHFFHLIYNVNSNILKVIIINDKNVEIENYTYDIINKKVINCKIGICNNYEEMVNILNKNVLYLLID